MSKFPILSALLLSSSFALAQAASPSLEAPATLPVVFTKSISADHVRAGDPVVAKTTQAVRLTNGQILPSGSRVGGHVLEASGFSYDKTPYAKQKASVLSIQFDSVQAGAATIPLHVTVRAMADPITSWDAQRPKASDIDSLGTLTQIGGDQLVPSQSEVVDQSGDVVAYNRKGGVYAHLIAHNDCDGSEVEVSMGSYSASACGLYGFTGVTAMERGSSAEPSKLTLASTHDSPKVWKNTTALLEVVPTQQASR
ncbi:MAG TPA: hypothetical protein VGB69_07200 [Edaphobacter sp.]